MTVFTNLLLYYVYLKIKETAISFNIFKKMYSIVKNYN